MTNRKQAIRPNYKATDELPKQYWDNIKATLVKCGFDWTYWGGGTTIVKYGEDKTNRQTITQDRDEQKRTTD